MTLQDVFGLARDVVMAAAWVLVWVVRRESARTDERFAEVKEALSRLSIEQLRQVFVAKERMDDLLRESHDDHAAIWGEITRLRDKL